MKHRSFFQSCSTTILCICLMACNSQKHKIITLAPMTASGDFLFEGPNTLQGSFELNAALLASKTGLTMNEIQAVHVETISLTVQEDSVSEFVESALVQLVSNELSLQSVGTLNGLTAEANQLNANKTLDIFQYIKDESTTVVIDANLTQDMDMLNMDVVFELSIKY